MTLLWRVNQNWTLRELKRQFYSSLYERLALRRDNTGIKKLSEKGQVIEKHADVMVILQMVPHLVQRILIDALGNAINQKSIEK